MFIILTANLESVRNVNFPVPNGYYQTKDSPKKETESPFSGRTIQSVTTANIEVNITSPNISSTGATTPRPTRKVRKQKKAEGIGNDDISLLCPGSLKVTGVRAFEVSGNTDTIKDFDKYCQANLVPVDASNVMCILSLRRVYKSRYPPFVKTVVTYECSYTEFVS
ncbi:hypothetical protein P5673_019416 [Acropora cervicornis]|uniref:Uncharacterized protein n=1 Tax=Acropora cervicornis TaxID=6130 RepID=A0AAD9QBS6_ACRCE|nr:hypothetical protein P5673_019416 [Acropora cervicornis]